MSECEVEEDWTPSESELKILQAKRERQDKISKIMGGYLLKGYKMLSTTCPVCSTILMRTRPANGATGDGVDYCISCVELDSSVPNDNSSTENQVTEQKEASQQQQQLLVDGKTTATQDAMLVSMRMGRPDTNATQIESCTAFGTLRKCDPPRVSSDELGARARCAMPSICPSVKVKEPTLCHQSSLDSSHQQNPQQQQQCCATSSSSSTSISNQQQHQQHLNICMTHHHYNYQQQQQQLLNSSSSAAEAYDNKLKESLQVVAQKLDWATDLLKKSVDVEHSRQLVSLIMACAEAIKSLKSVYHHIVTEKIEESN